MLLKEKFLSFPGFSAQSLCCLYCLRNGNYIAILPRNLIRFHKNRHCYQLLSIFCVNCFTFITYYPLRRFGIKHICLQSWWFTIVNHNPFLRSSPTNTGCIYSTRNTKLFNECHFFRPEERAAMKSTHNSK